MGSVGIPCSATTFQFQFHLNLVFFQMVMIILVERFFNMLEAWDNMSHVLI